MRTISTPEDLKGIKSKFALEVRLFVQGMVYRTTVRECRRYFELLAEGGDARAHLRRLQG